MADTPTAPRAAAGERGTRFGYLLNAMERAAQAEYPAKEGYAEKRRAVLQYVESSDAEARALREALHAVAHRTEPLALLVAMAKAPMRELLPVLQEVNRIVAGVVPREPDFVARTALPAREEDGR